MHTRRLASILLGFWIGLSAAMSFVAIQNFRGVDSILESPPEQIAKVSDQFVGDTLRRLFRFQAAEMNRQYFAVYCEAQIALALLLGATLVFAAPGNKLILAVGAALLLMVLAERFLLLPQITTLGRALDFADESVQSVLRTRFRNHHTLFSLVEVVKAGTLILLGFRMLTRRENLPH